jgi:hypothetical protein
MSDEFVYHKYLIVVKSIFDIYSLFPLKTLCCSLSLLYIRMCDQGSQIVMWISLGHGLWIANHGHDKS